MKNKRIWELDALRGLCILCMVVVHFFFDLGAFTQIDLTMPGWFAFIKQYGHIIFILISGICVTFSSRSFRRGIIVFAAGLVITAVTVFLVYVLDFTKSIMIFFGILHMLGLCMMLYPLFKKMPIWLQALLGVAFVALGFWFDTMIVDVKFLFPFGLTFPGFFSGDYFPLFPGLGWFLLGAVIGRTLYSDKKSRLPKVNENFFLIRFFSWCGRQSLWIYMLHQPVLMGIVYLFF